MNQPANKLFLLDAMALIYRAHFAFLKNPRINAQGMNTGAILGFTNALVEIIQKEKPTHIAIAFDLPEPTFRHKAFEAYKQQRQAQPEDITVAIPYIKKIVKAFQIPVVEKAGYEADDVIGTLACQAAQAAFDVYIMTTDKDFAQLVNDHIYLYKPPFMGNRSQILGVKDILKKWEIATIDQVRDILGLQGDVSDNIPGIPNIGPKTAVKLIQTFGSIENLLKNSHQLIGKLKENVVQYGDQGLLSKKLATIHTKVPLAFDLAKSRYEKPNETVLKSIFTTLEFRTLTQRIFGKKTSEAPQATLFALNEAPQQPTTATMSHQSPSPPPLATIHTQPHQYHCINTDVLQKKLIEHLALQDEFCF